MFCRIILTIKSLSSINVLQIIWPYSISYQFYAVVGSADKDPHSIDKLSNLAESRRYLRNALPPYGREMFESTLKSVHTHTTWIFLQTLTSGVNDVLCKARVLVCSVETKPLVCRNLYWHQSASKAFLLRVAYTGVWPTVNHVCGIVVRGVIYGLITLRTFFFYV